MSAWTAHLKLLRMSWYDCHSNNILWSLMPSNCQLACTAHLKTFAHVAQGLPRRGIGCDASIRQSIVGHNLECQLCRILHNAKQLHSMATKLGVSCANLLSRQHTCRAIITGSNNRSPNNLRINVMKNVPAHFLEHASLLAHVLLTQSCE